ncbi:MAG: hypothetical protein ACREI3_11715 [Nitrospirales bacterium]
MPSVGTSSTGGFACATATQRTLRDLQTKRRGQPVFVAGHIHERRGQEATFELFNVRLAVVKFSDDEVIGFDPSELLLPTEIDEKGVPFFEIRRCRTCDGYFPLTKEEAEAEEEPTQCPECAT